MKVLASLSPGQHELVKAIMHTPAPLSAKLGALKQLGLTLGQTIAILMVSHGHNGAVIMAACYTDLDYVWDVATDHQGLFTALKEVCPDPLELLDIFLAPCLVPGSFDLSKAIDEILGEEYGHGLGLKDVVQWLNSSFRRVHQANPEVTAMATLLEVECVKPEEIIAAWMECYPGVSEEEIRGYLAQAEHWVSFDEETEDFAKLIAQSEASYEAWKAANLAAYEAAHAKPS